MTQISVQPLILIFLHAYGIRIFKSVGPEHTINHYLRFETFLLFEILILAHVQIPHVYMDSRIITKYKDVLLYLKDGAKERVTRMRSEL